LEPLIENVERLCQTLPAAKAKKEADQLKSYSSRSKELMDRLGKEPPSDSPEASDQLMNDVFTEKSEIRRTGLELLGSLKSETNRAEARYHFFDWLSLALYTLGIVFSVTGQLLGVKDDASGS
jgi:hypothetical protein